MSKARSKRKSKNPLLTQPDSPQEPTEKSMKDVFYEIVEFAESQGCPIDVHPNLEKVNGSNGYFTSEPHPHIEVGLKGKTWPRAIQLIIHEFCHYWQHRDGFIGKKDDEGNIIYSRLLDGETITAQEREKARALIQISEYDCEIRTASLIKRWNLETVFPTTQHIRSSNTYNRHIAWSVGDKNTPGSGVFYYKYDSLADKLWGDAEFGLFWNPKTTAGQKLIVAPISKEHREVFDKACGIVRDKEGVPINSQKVAAKIRR